MAENPINALGQLVAKLAPTAKGIMKASENAGQALTLASLRYFVIQTFLEQRAG
jgi:hypothetical protein